MHNRPQNDCGAKTDESPPHQSCNQPESRPTEHTNLVRVKIYHLRHRPYSSPSCSVIAKRVQNIILRYIIIMHSINSLQVETHTSLNVIFPPNDNNVTRHCQDSSHKPHQIAKIKMTIKIVFSVCHMKPKNGHHYIRSM
jgi:hypothetical protein